ncbi:MAG: FAD-dependent oxidoreductase, partial [Maioricimonas sp. JB049]
MFSRTRSHSVWLSEAPLTGYSELRGELIADVAVIGGGIAGLTTALELQRAGQNVVLVEAERIGCGVTGASTAKVTSLHGAIY